MTVEIEKPRASLDDKYECESGRVFISGTQAIIRMCLEQRQRDLKAGLNTGGYITGYRGSPMGGVDATAYREQERLEAHGIVFKPAVNEELAATAVWGTQQLDAIPGAKVDGVFALWYGKGPGVERACDALRHGNTAGSHAKGGVVLAYGDDHPGKSSTVAHQSEQTLAAVSVPSLYPSSAAEILEYGLLAWAMSRYSGSWVGLKCVNEVVEQTATVDIDAVALSIVSPDIPDELQHPAGRHIHPMVFNPAQAETVVQRMRLPLVQKFVRANRIDRPAFGAAQPRLGIVSAGKSWQDVLQALSLLGIDEARANVLGIGAYKVGCIWPLEPEGLTEFTAHAETLLFVEEKHANLELQARDVLYSAENRPTIYGKKGPNGETLLPSDLQFHALETAQAIAAVLAEAGALDTELQALISALPSALAAPTQMPPRGMIRTPYFCSGCPHNSSTKVPDGSMAMSGIGCHTMVIMRGTGETLPPTQMGGEGANWIGLSHFTDTKHIFQNLGDGTYFHSGLLAVRAAIAAKNNVTFKILFNDAVAMTGGQPHDGDVSVDNIVAQVLAEGVTKCVVCTPEPELHKQLPSGVELRHRDDLDALQREMREISGTTVIVYQQTCAAEKRRRRKRGTYPDPAKRQYINPAVCEGCGDCAVQSSCVSLQPVDTPFGTKRRVDQNSCNKDYSCVKGFCPSFVTVLDAEPRKPAVTGIDESLFEQLPEPAVADCTNGYAVMTAGIGGTGVVTVGAVLGMAAHLDGYSASVYDMTGLAQKNGAVFSHLRIAKNKDSISTQRVGRGEADLILAFDLLAAVQPEAFGSMQSSRTALVGNNVVAPSAFYQIEPGDKNRPPQGAAQAKLSAVVKEDAFFLVEGTRLAEEFCGDTVAVNLMMMGFAAQRGLLPVTMQSLLQAVALNGVAVEFNRRAFNVGRLLAHQPDSLKLPVADVIGDSLDALISHRSAHLQAYQSKAWSQRYEQFVQRVQQAEQSLGGEALTRATASNLAKLMSYKDEYEVARLYSSPEFMEGITQHFEDGARLQFNLAPPLLAKRDKTTGLPQKRSYGSWMLKAFAILAPMKKLRGTALDVFSYTAERKMERQLITDFEERMVQVLDDLTVDNYRQAIALAELPEMIKGYGHVKECAVEQYYLQQTQLIQAFDQAVQEQEAA